LYRLFSWASFLRSPKVFFLWNNPQFQES
jgi:hypothetical protein